MRKMRLGEVETFPGTHSQDRAHIFIPPAPSLRSLDLEFKQGMQQALIKCIWADYFIPFLMALISYGCVHVHKMHVWRSEDKLWDPIFSIHCRSLRDGTQIKPLYQVDHITIPD